MISIRRSLTLWLIPGLLAILAAGGAGLFFTVRSILTSDFDASLRIKAQALATLIKSEDGQIEVEFLNDRMTAFDRGMEPEFFEIRSEDGAVLGRSGNLGSLDLQARPGSFDAPDFRNVNLPDGRPGRAAGIRFRPVSEVEEEGRPVVEAAAAGGEVTLVVARDRTDLDKTLAAIGVGIGGIGLGMIAASAFMVGTAVRRGLRPLDHLSDRVASIEASSLSERFPADAMPAELKPVCGRLNDLLARLEQSFQRERRFSANVAHELRTPIAELRSMAEVALKYPEDEAADARTIREALAIAIQMQTLVETLLRVGRCQSGRECVRRESVPLSKLVEEVWRPLETPARNKGLVVSNELPSDTVIDTDPGLFRTIVQNLLSNAVEYAPAGGRVGIGWIRTNGGFEVKVDNTCESLTPDDLSHLTEPFWRKDAARTNSSHAGLGLTLASECARLLSMELSADLSTGNQLNQLRMTLHAGSV